jgi:hypothetical protein
MRHVRIDDVIVARSDAAAAEPLPAGLPRKTYTEVIIVRDDMVLIDGLRRLLWHRAQGHEVAPAVVVSTFPEALEQLGPQHADRHERLTPIRAWNLISAVTDYARIWGRQKANGGWVEGPDGNKTQVRGEEEPKKSMRKQLSLTLRLPENKIQAAMFLYRRAEAGDSIAQALATRVEAGDFGVIHATRLYRTPHNLTGNVTVKAEQRIILERGTEAFEAQVNSLSKLGHPLVVPTEELREAVDRLVKARGQLSTLLSGFRSVLKERENHG